MGRPLVGRGDVVSDDMVTRIVVGIAERCDADWADTADGSAWVRIYRDASGGAWMGTDTDEILYYDSPSCLHHATSGEHPGALCLGDAIVFPDGTTWDVSRPDGDWPDYDVHCDHCGDVIRADDD